MPLNESELRTDAFTEGRPVTLGDGQPWHLPKTTPLVRPVFEGGRVVDMGIFESHGTESDAIIREMRGHDGEDILDYIILRLNAAALLLTRNYRLDDDALDILLRLDTADPTAHDRWAALDRALFNLPEESPTPAAE